jgi:hypothetical protein
MPQYFGEYLCGWAVTIMAAYGLIAFAFHVSVELFKGIRSIVKEIIAWRKARDAREAQAKIDSRNSWLNGYTMGWTQVPQAKLSQAEFNELVASPLSPEAKPVPPPPVAPRPGPPKWPQPGPLSKL